MKLPELLLRYQNGQRHFTDLDLQGSLKGQDLSGAIFEKCFLLVDFSHCNLSNAQFLNGNVKYSDFRYANLTNSIFRRVAVEGTQFQGAQTEGLVFDENYCYSATLYQEDFKLFIV